MFELPLLPNQEQARLNRKVYSRKYAEEAEKINKERNLKNKILGRNKATAIDVAHEDAIRDNEEFDIKRAEEKIRRDSMTEEEKLMEIKERLLKHIDACLSEINIGSTVIDKDFDPDGTGWAEDLFDDANNKKEVLKKASSIIDEAIKDKRSKDILRNELESIKVRVFGEQYKEDEGFNPFHKEFVSLSEFTRIEDILTDWKI